MGKIIHLAIPAIISNLAGVGMGCVDTITAGKVSSTDMAGVALGFCVFIPVLLFAGGILMILGPIISNMRGKGNDSRVGYLMGHGTWLAGSLSIVVILVLLLFGNIFPMITDDGDMMNIAHGYLMATLWGVPAHLGFITLKSLNEGTNMTRPAMFVSIIGLLVNIPANIIFVFGYLGMPALGGVGCGVATSIVFWVQFIAMAIMVYHHPRHRSYRRQLLVIRRPAMDTLKMILKLGFPVGISLLFEVLLFTASSLLLAPLGHIQVASHQVASNISGVLFMIPLSIGLSASIRVAYHSGKKNMDGINQAMRCSYTIIGVFMFVSIAIIIFLRGSIVRLYNSEADIVVLASTLLLFAAIYQVPDMLQVVSSGILRGFRDTVSITYISFFSYWIIGFPICAILARSNWIVPAMGAPGVWIGYIFGLAVASVLYIIRVIKIRRREKALIFDRL